MSWAERQPQAAALAVPAALAGAVLALAYEQGGFGAGIWTVAAIVLWWTILLATIVDPRASFSRGAALTAGLLALLALVAGLSALWGAGNEEPFLALGRDAFYAGAFVAGVRFATTATAARWCDGIAAGIVAVELLALATRFFPRAFSASVTEPLVPDAYSRLSYPVGYWNGLAALVALACPLLLRRAIAPGRWSDLALLPLPGAATVAYLASSRTGAISIAIGVLLFAAAARSRRAFAAAAASTLAALAAVLAVSREDAVVNGPVRSAAAVGGGRWAALAVVAAAIAAVGLFRALAALGERASLTGAARRAVAAAVIAVVVAAVALVHPVRRWHDFTAEPATFQQTGYIQSHFVSANGNWRYQFWRASVDEFKTSPLVGKGVGSFSAWWDRHGPGFVANPHSLYFETLGDLGLVGLAVLLGAFTVGIASGLRRLRTLQGESRAAVAAAVAAFAAFAVAAGVDWLWQLPVVPATALLLLGVALAPEGRAGISAKRWAPAVLVSAALLASLLEADLKMGNWLVASSRAAAARGDLTLAADRARLARTFEPWASSPRLQLAIVEEARGRFPAADASIRQAIARDRDTWQLYAVLARIEHERGDEAAAAASLAVARSLNPHARLTTGG